MMVKGEMVKDEMARYALSRQKDAQVNRVTPHLEWDMA
jgi:hypothetical protein